MEWLVMEIPILICMFIFGGIGFYALRAKKPMHFWSWTTVKAESVTDVKAYNRANAKMWFAYDIPYVMAFFAAPFAEGLQWAVLHLQALLGLAY